MQTKSSVDKVCKLCLKQFTQACFSGGPKYFTGLNKSCILNQQVRFTDNNLIRE